MKLPEHYQLMMRFYHVEAAGFEVIETWLAISDDEARKLGARAGKPAASAGTEP
jgi:hypothetical protein